MTNVFSYEGFISILLQNDGHRWGQYLHFDKIMLIYCLGILP